MFKIFLKNFFRALLTAVVVALVAGVLTIIITVVAELVGEMVAELQKKADTFEVTAMAFLIIDCVAAAIVSFLWFALMSVKGNWFFSGANDCVKHPPIVIFGILLIIVVPLAIAGVCGWMLYTGYDRLIAGIAAASGEENPFTIHMVLLAVLPAVAVSQLGFAIAMTVHYKGCQICRCGRMFCIDYNLTDVSSYSKTKYKTKTTREKVGTISAGDTKIADVTADVTRGHYETTTITHNHYDGRCIKCGREKSHSSTE